MEKKHSWEDGWELSRNNETSTNTLPIWAVISYWGGFTSQEHLVLCGHFWSSELSGGVGGGASGQRPEMPLCPPMYRTFPTTKNHPVKMSTELRWRNTKSPHWLFPWPGMLFLQLFTRQLLFMNSLNSSRLREALPEHPISSRPSPLLAHGSTAPEHSSPSPCLG